MHISDGILNLPITLTGYGLSALLTGYSLKRSGDRQIPSIAVMSAALFAASLIHFRIGGSSVHLTLLGLVTVILGNRAPAAIAVGLFFQAALFHHGGLTSLGANAAVMICATLPGGVIFRFMTRHRHHRSLWVSFSAGLATLIILLTATLFSVILLLVSGEAFSGLAVLFGLSSIALAVIEAFITAFAVHRIHQIRPEMIGAWG